MKRLTVRQFRSTFSSLEEPVEVGAGLWIPDRSKASDVLRELVGATDVIVVDTANPQISINVSDVLSADERSRRARETILAQQAARDAVLRRLSTKREK